MHNIKFSNSIDRSLDACYQYFITHSEIKKLTQRIQQQSEIECSSKQELNGKLTSCLDRKFGKSTKQLKIVDCCRCKTVQKIINKRKKAKKQLGICKRKVFYVGKVISKEIRE